MGATTIALKRGTILLYRCIIKGTDNINQYEELIKVFIPLGGYVMLSQDAEADGAAVIDVSRGREAAKRQLYRSLEEYTGKSPKWALLQGYVR